jgi:HTH-type transcriptional regulator, competence development regulator
MKFGEQIRQWREERGIGLRRFARAIGVSPAFIFAMERGKGPIPGEECILKMAQIFGQDPDALLAMAGKVAAEVQALIKREPAIARFIRENANLTKNSGLHWRAAP